MINSLDFSASLSLSLSLPLSPSLSLSMRAPQSTSIRRLSSELERSPASCSGGGERVASHFRRHLDETLSHLESMMAPDKYCTIMYYHVLSHRYHRGKFLTKLEFSLRHMGGRETLCLFLVVPQSWRMCFMFLLFHLGLSLGFCRFSNCQFLDSFYSLLKNTLVWISGYIFLH